jgi:iron complex outermembrane receptor protein
MGRSANCHRELANFFDKPCPQYKGMLMTVRWTRLLAAHACSLVAIVASQLFCVNVPAATDTTSSGELEEVVVTAQKRVENLQNVPIAATVVSEESLTQKGLFNIGDLAPLVPNLNIFMGDGHGTPEFTLRGIGSASYQRNSSSTVAIYLDEFVLDTPTTQVGQLFDLQRVEALAGPQGTLYGKNSTGGAINFITRRPDGTSESNGTVTVGRFGEINAQVAGQTAITDGLSLRLAFNRNYSDGYSFNPVTDQHTDGLDDWGARLGLVYKTDNLNVFWKMYADANYNAQLDSEVLGVNTDGTTRPDNTNGVTKFKYPTVYDVSYQAYGHINQHNYGTAVNADYSLGDYTLTSISGYVDSVHRAGNEFSGSPLPEASVPHSDVSSHQISQELRVTSPDVGALKWIAGANFFHKYLRTYSEYDLGLGFLPSIRETDIEHTTSYAGFIDGTLKLGGGFSLIGGVRLTHDEKEMFFFDPAFSFIGPFNKLGTASWTEPTYRGVLNYQLNDQTLVYLSYNHGYRSGSFDSGLKSSPSQLVPANPEFVNNYEAGAKTTLFDNHLRLSSAFYYMRFLDMQLDALATYPAAICCSIVNAGLSRIVGAELEATAVVHDNVDIHLEATGDEGKFLKFQNGTNNYDGVTLGRLPTYKIRVSPEYHVPFHGGDIFLAPDVTVTGTTRVSTLPDLYGRDVQRAYTIVDAQFGYRQPKWSVFGWVKNATNYRVLMSTDLEASLGYMDLIHGPPMSFGITVTARY